MKWNKNYKKSLRSVAYLQFQTAQSPPTDSICAMVVVWRGNIDRTAVSCVVYDSCAQQYAHKCDQLLNLYLVRFSLVCVCVLCKCFVCIFVCFHVSLDHFFVLLVNFVRFGFFSVPSQEMQEHLQNDLFCVEFQTKACLHLTRAFTSPRISCAHV